MTFSWELDNVDALQCVVKRDLKCSGIRISKKKDVHKNHQAQEITTSTLFGKALHSCLLVQDEESRCYIPRFLLECTEFLDDHLDMEGIFRISGSKSRQRDLQKNLENGSCIPNDANPADVCSLFKYFFHNLPEPLISSKLQSALYKCSLIEDVAEQRWVVLNICHLLPSVNIQTLRFTALFLHRVASKSEKNRMDVTNLAKVFTPSLFGSFTALDKKNPEKMIGLQTSMVSLMIENARLIGEVPDWMIEKITGHNQSRENLDRLTSEDELEKSDDNLEESGRLSRRRRRKSGPSFQVLVSGLGHSLGILKTASSTENILSTDTHAMESPKIMKRKASEDLGSAFTSTKRKALLHKMTTDPQFSKPGLHLHRTHHGTPNQPALGEADAVTADGETLFRYDTPSIVYADDSFAGHTPSRLAGSEFTHKGHDRWQGTPKSKLKRFKELSARKLKRRSLVMNLDGEPFSTKSPKASKTQGNKRKESKDVGWRLANASPPEGGLDTLKIFDHPVRPSPNFDAPGRARRHNKTPSSPARLLTGASPVLRRSVRLHTSDSESDVCDSMKPIRFSAGDSPKVVIVDTQERAVASPKVVVVDTNMISESNITKEYVKKQQEHASQLIGSKLGKERTSPSIYIPDSTRQKIKAAQMVYATQSSMEDEHLQEMADQDISSEDEVHAKDMTPSTSQKSLSSVLSGISVCSHKSEVGQFTSEPNEKQPATSYMETDICSPCVYECDDGTMVAVEDSPKDHTDSASPVETGNPQDTMDHKNSPVKETHIDDILMAHLVQQDTKDNRTVKVSLIIEGHSNVVHRPDAGKTTMSKSESIDSGKGCSMEDLYGATAEGKSEMQPPKVPMKQDSLDAGLDEGNEEKEEMKKELDLSKDLQSKEIQDQTDIAHQQGNMNRVDIENIEINLKNCNSNENVNVIGKVMSFREGQVSKDDTFKVPLSVDNTSDSDLQNLINSALKSDMKKSLGSQSTTLPVHVHCGQKRRKKSSIVKANIQLFNSFSTSDRDISVCTQGSMRKTRAPNQKETTPVSKPLTPLTKSTSMDSGISDFQTSRHPMSTRSRDLNESFLTAVESKASLKILSSSMENISTPKEEYSASTSSESRPIQSSQSMLDISTPTSVNRPPVIPIRNVRSMQNVSTPNNKENLSTPASIRRRRPVSQRQKMAFQESDSFAKLKREKAFEVEEEASSLPMVKPLGDNNSPQLHRTRKPAPLDPRLAVPLTPVHLAQHVRLRTPSSSRRPVNIKHRSPVKPVKRLVKSPSPARSKGRLTPERDNRTPKRYPRSPRNPLEMASPSSRRQRSAVPVHVQDEWEL